jgi:YcxB-like protein
MTKNNNYNLTFTLDDAKSVDLSRFSFKTWILTTIILIFLLSSPDLFKIFILTSASKQNEVREAFYKFLLMYSSVFLLSFIGYLWIFHRHKYLKRKSKPSKIIVINVTDLGWEIIANSEMSIIKHDWSFFINWEEDNNAFIAYIHNSYYPIPKKAFSNEKQINNFRELLTEKLSHR